LNFFAEKHGKNQRDQHFSNISYFLEKHSLIKRLVCTQDIVNAVIKHQNLTNEERINWLMNNNINRQYKRRSMLLYLMIIIIF
jgi:hypothetical protein